MGIFYSLLMSIKLIYVDRNYFINSCEGLKHERGNSNGRMYVGTI